MNKQKKEVVETIVQKLEFIDLVPGLKPENIINIQKSFCGMCSVFWLRDKK